MNVLELLAEQRIAEAERDGLLQDLPGAGAPLAPDDDAERFAGTRSTRD